MSADNEISVGCKQPSDRMRINTTDLNYTATRKNTSYTTAVSCDLEGRSGVLLMPSGRPTLIGGSADAIRPADSFWLKPLDGSGREGSADANRPADPFWLSLPPPASPPPPPPLCDAIKHEFKAQRNQLTFRFKALHIAR